MIKLDEKQWNLLLEKYCGFHDALMIVQRVSWNLLRQTHIADVYLDITSCHHKVKEEPIAHFRFLDVKSCRFGVVPNKTDCVVYNMHAWWQSKQIIVDLTNGSDFIGPPTDHEIETELDIMVCKEISFELCSAM